MKQVGSALTALSECVTESLSDAHFISFVLDGRSSSKVPTRRTTPTALACRRMPWNGFPVTHTERHYIEHLQYKIIIIYIYFQHYINVVYAHWLNNAHIHRAYEIMEYILLFIIIW